MRQLTGTGRQTDRRIRPHIDLKFAEKKFGSNNFGKKSFGTAVFEDAQNLNPLPHWGTP